MSLLILDSLILSIAGPDKIACVATAVTLFAPFSIAAFAALTVVPAVSIDTAGTTVNAANAAIENGANSVTAVATHAILSGPAIDRIKESKISKLIVTDTVAIPESKKLDSMEIVTVSEVFAEAIKRVYDGKSVSALFEF